MIVGELEFDAKAAGRSRKSNKKIIILYQWGYTGMKIWFYKNIFSFMYQWGYTGTKKQKNFNIPVNVYI